MSHCTGIDKNETFINDNKESKNAGTKKKTNPNKDESDNYRYLYSESNQIVDSGNIDTSAITNETNCKINKNLVKNPNNQAISFSNIDTNSNDYEPGKKKRRLSKNHKYCDNIFTNVSNASNQNNISDGIKSDAKKNSFNIENIDSTTSCVEGSILELLNGVLRRDPHPLLVSINVNIDQST